MALADFSQKINQQCGGASVHLKQLKVFHARLTNQSKETCLCGVELTLGYKKVGHCISSIHLKINIIILNLGNSILGLYIQYMVCLFSFFILFLFYLFIILSSSDASPWHIKD